jgi:nitrate reductase (NAD(P)H)
LLLAPAVDLMQAREICCRGYDSHQNSQPNTFTWNLMGMMNNCVYRVKVRCCT